MALTQKQVSEYMQRAWKDTMDRYTKSIDQQIEDKIFYSSTAGNAHMEGKFLKALEGAGYLTKMYPKTEEDSHLCKTCSMDCDCGEYYGEDCFGCGTCGEVEDGD